MKHGWMEVQNNIQHAAMCTLNICQPTGADSQLRTHTHRWQRMIKPTSSIRKNSSGSQTGDMNVLLLIVPCCFAMWQEAEPGLFACWAMAPVQTAPCAHSALNGPWNQSHLAAIMPFSNLLLALEITKALSPLYYCSTCNLEYLVPSCWDTHTHIHKCQEQALSFLLFPFQVYWFCKN